MKKNLTANLPSCIIFRAFLQQHFMHACLVVTICVRTVVFGWYMTFWKRTWGKEFHGGNGSRLTFKESKSYSSRITVQRNFAKWRLTQMYAGKKRRKKPPPSPSFRSVLLLLLLLFPLQLQMNYPPVWRRRRGRGGGCVGFHCRWHSTVVTRRVWTMFRILILIQKNFYWKMKLLTGKELQLIWSKAGFSQPHNHLKDAVTEDRLLGNAQGREEPRKLHRIMWS